MLNGWDDVSEHEIRGEVLAILAHAVIDGADYLVHAGSVAVGYVELLAACIGGMVAAVLEGERGRWPDPEQVMRVALDELRGFVAAAAGV